METLPKVVIPGANGFVGRALARTLRDRLPRFRRHLDALASTPARVGAAP